MLICLTYEQRGGLTVPGLDGAAVIVTGGGSGIGAATARQLGLAVPAADLAQAYRWLGSQVPLGRIGARRRWPVVRPAGVAAVIPLDGGQVIDRE